MVRGGGGGAGADAVILRPWGFKETVEGEGNA